MALAVVGHEEEAAVRGVVEVRQQRLAEGARQRDPVADRPSPRRGRARRRRRRRGRRGSPCPSPTPSFASRRHATRPSPPARPAPARRSASRARRRRPAPDRSAAPARPCAPIISAFQLARTFSSRNGLGRVSRTSNIARRARSERRPFRGVAGVPRPRESTVRPARPRSCRRRSLPTRASPRARPPRRRAHAASTSAGVQTKNRPSSPSLSASCVAKKPPSGAAISRRT